MARYLGLHDADGGALLVLDSGSVDGASPFLVTKVDLGAVDVRDDVDDDPSGSGTLDNTRFTNGRGVTVELTALGTPAKGPYAWLDDVDALCDPAAPVYLHIGIDDWPGPARRILVRGASSPLDLTERTPDVQYQWRAPRGYLEDAAATEVDLIPVGVLVPGLAAPVSAPVFAPPANPSGGPSIVVGGRRRPWWELDVYGPCIAPRLTSGAGWAVAGADTMTIAAGHFNRFTPDSITGPIVTGDGDPNQDQYGLLDFGVTSWQPLEVGDNDLALTATSFGDGFRAVLRWRNR